jgi:SAM-dependent methyltransferase
MRKQYIEVPLPMSFSFVYRLWIRVKGMFLSPLYLIVAGFIGAPGFFFHLRCMAMGVFFLVTGRVPLRTCYKYIFFPMDSTRYFEFHEAWNGIYDLHFKRYLDISSPRLLPLLLLKKVSEATAEFINPDAGDLSETENLANALGLKSRCNFVNGTLNSAGFTQSSFDLITCISVLEHIPDDRAVIETMWSLLRPGGRLVLTFPCMSEPLEQYISYNQYGVLRPGEDGYTFWQRYYDHKRIESTVYEITGLPKRIVIYGEKKSGLFFRNASMKRLLGSLYPFWREPYMMATEYKYFKSCDELPGEGVAMLEFIKNE